jgi:hypothetical protein
MAKNTNTTPVYTVKRFGPQYWIERNGSHFHGRVDPLMDISVSKYFNNSAEAWEWVEYLEEGVVDVPKPSKYSVTLFDVARTTTNFDSDKDTNDYNPFLGY